MNKQEIIEAITKANKIYWGTGENGLPESEYNTLLQQLQEIDPDHLLLKEVSAPAVSSLGKIVHKQPMLSLDKVYSIEELKKWMKKVSRNENEEFEITTKYDGIAARIEGKVLSTRGDGETGEDISHFLPILTINLDMDNKDLVKNGEILIDNLMFDREFASGLIRRSNGEKYKTARNATAGILNNDHVEDQWFKVMTFIEHTRYKTISTLRTIEDRIEYAKEATRLLGIPNDGLVLKLKDEKYAESLGYNSHHWKHSMALKHANESTITRLIGVEFQMAKDHIGMVGILQPVEIGGVTVKRVSLHNLDIVKSLGVMINDTVKIERAGDVIPHIVSVAVDEELRDKLVRKKIELFVCPSCYGPVRIDNQFYVCDNDNCEDKLVNKIDSAFKDLGSKGIATETIRIWVRHDFKNIGAILEGDFSMCLYGRTGFGTRKITKIKDEIGRLKSIEHKPENILAALNIPGFGKSLFKKLLKEVISITKLNNMKILEYADLPNMSVKRSEMLRDGLDKEAALLYTLLITLKIKESKPKGETMGANGTVCFTGTGNKGRKEYAELAEAAGMEVASSVSASLGLLVCADPESNSSKMQKALRNGTKVISYNEFETMVG